MVVTLNDLFSYSIVKCFVPSISGNSLCVEVGSLPPQVTCVSPTSFVFNFIPYSSIVIAGYSLVRSIKTSHLD